MSANTGTYYFEFTSIEKYVLWGLSASNNNADLGETGDIKVFPTNVNQVKVSDVATGDTFDLIESLTPTDVKGLGHDSATGLVIFYVNGVEFTRHTLDNSLVYKFGALTRNWEEGTESIYLVTDPALQTYAPLGSGNGSVLGVDGNSRFAGIVTATGGVVANLTGDINSSGLSTVTNLDLNGYVSAGNTFGESGMVLTSVGAGVTWKNVVDTMPQTRTFQTFTATAGQTAFSFVYNVNYLDVFVNGVKLTNAEFTATDGQNITIIEPLFADDVVEFYSYSVSRFWFRYCFQC